MTEDAREKAREMTKTLLEREIEHIKGMSAADGVRMFGLVEKATGRKLSEAEVEQVARRMEEVKPCDFWGPTGCQFPREHTKGARACRCGKLAPGRHYT
jgi:hypothetical protein